MGITWSGFVKFDYISDSRLTSNLREGHFELYPLRVVKNSAGKDLNAVPSSEMLAVQSRLTGKIVGPDFMGGKTSGMLEGEFFGTSDGDINGFRMRHAMAKVAWTKSEVMVGQYWHPMFVPECYPGVYNFNTGVPFEPFNRSPQIRFTAKPSAKLKIIAALAEERDFQSFGPAGTIDGSGVSTTSTGGNLFQRYSALPNGHLQLQFTQKNIVGGIGADFKSLRPRIKTLNNSLTDTKVSSSAFTAYLKAGIKKLTWKVQGTYGSNMSDMVMLGGYAETSVDSARGYTYSASKLAAVWTEFSGMLSKKVEGGLFIGYTKQLGLTDGEVKGAVYGRGLGAGSGTSIDNIVRFSGRLGLKEGKMTFGLEGEYTLAQYGTMQSDGKVKPELSDGSSLDPVGNFRIMLTGIYAF